MNLRRIGGRTNPFKHPSIDEPEENPALEPEEEEWGFPYRFTEAFIDSVSHIYDLINDNGDYEQARTLFFQNNIGTIFREDMRRLRHDLSEGMELDAEEEQLIKDLSETIIGIMDELKHHFGKRLRGGRKLNPQDREVFQRQLDLDFKKDVSRVRRLLGEADEEIIHGDIDTARQDLKQVNRIMEEYHTAFLFHGITNFEFPRDVLDEYERLMRKLRNEETHENNDENDIQFDEDDWEYLGAGISRERENVSNIRSGGAVPERIEDTLSPSPHLMIRKSIRHMRGLIEEIDELLDNPNHTEADVVSARRITRKVNEELDYFDNHYSDIATERYLNGNGLMEDYNNIVEQVIFLNQFFRMDYGSSESKTT